MKLDPDYKKELVKNTPLYREFMIDKMPCCEKTWIKKQIVLQWAILFLILGSVVGGAFYVVKSERAYAAAQPKIVKVVNDAKIW